MPRIAGALLAIACIAWLVFRDVPKRRVVAQPFELRSFTGTHNVDEWADVSTSGTKVAYENGVANVSGDGDAWFRGNPRRIGTRDWITLRFTVTQPGAYDVVAGFEAVGADPPFRILAAYRGDGTCSIEGDLDSQKTSGAVTRIHECIPSSTSDHEVRLDIYSAERAVIGRVDGYALPARDASWWERTEVRPIFGVRSREHGTDIGVSLREMEVQHAPDDYGHYEVEDRFTAPILDPQKWLVYRTDRAQADSTVVTSPLGLHFTARPFVGHVLPAGRVSSRQFPLRSFDAGVEVDFAVFAKSGFFLRISGEKYWVPRRFEVGVVDENDGLSPYCAGGWSGGDVIDLRGDAWRGLAPLTATLRLEYSSASGDAHASLNGIEMCVHKPDVAPFTDVQLDIGANLDDKAARYDLHVRRAWFHER